MVIILDEFGVAEDAQNRDGAGRDKPRVNGFPQYAMSTNQDTRKVPAA